MRTAAGAAAGRQEDVVRPSPGLAAGRRLALVAVAALALSPVGAAAQTSIPLERDTFDLWTIHARAGGTDAVFVVDLGAGSEVLSSAFGSRVRLGDAGVFTGFRSTGQRVDAARVRIAPIAIGPAATPSDASVWAGLDGSGLDGLVSARTFAASPVTLDFANRRLVFETPESLAERVRRGAVLPVTTDSYRGLALDVFVDFDLGGGRTGRCELDTGSGAVDLNARYLPDLGLARDSLATTRMPGSTATFYRGRLPGSLAPVGAPALAVDRPAVRFGDYIYDCIVGLSFWTRTTLTLDLPHGRIIVAAAGAGAGTR